MPARPSTTPRKPARTKPTAAEVRPGLFVGGWGDAQKFSGTKFCVLDEAPPDMPAATHVAIFDEATEEPIVSSLDQLSELISAARTREEPVLVFCGHGVRRSPLAVAWHLHRSESIPLDDAFDRIRAVRPFIEPVHAWAKGWKVLEAADRRRSGSAGRR